MSTDLIGQWVEVKLSSGKTWVGKIEEYDEEALFISNGNEFGHPDHKGAECTIDEISSVAATDKREFFVE
jgi:ribosome maturation factor RimP